MDRPVTICLALHQGGRHVGAQLESLENLAGPWRLIVSDDGSTDDGPTQVRSFAARLPPDRVRLVDGPRRGAAANFLHLVEVAPSGALAFCDQDDVWLPSRITAGQDALAAVSGPAVHLGRTLVCSADLVQRRDGPPHRRAPGFRNALIQAGGPGNAMTLNPAAVSLLKRGVAAAQAAEIPAHDWWVYQMVTGAGGLWLAGDEVTVLYRQHDRNVVGRNDTLRARAARAAMLVDGTFARWLAGNQRALECSQSLLSADSRIMVAEFGAALRMAGPAAAERLRRLAVHRDSTAGTALVIAAAAAGRLRTPRG